MSKQLKDSCCIKDVLLSGELQVVVGFKPVDVNVLFVETPAVFDEHRVSTLSLSLSAAGLSYHKDEQTVTQTVMSALCFFFPVNTWQLVSVPERSLKLSSLSQTCFCFRARKEICNEHLQY